MNSNDKLQIYKAINAVSNRLNEVNYKLDTLIQYLDKENKDNINLNAGGLNEIADITSTHDEAIAELAELVGGESEVTE